MFRGEAYVFDSPAAAVSAFAARVRSRRAAPAAGTIALDDALGRVLAQDARADRDSPAFDHSSMDGYAVRTPDLLGRAAPVVLPVPGESRIGTPAPPMPASPAAIRVSTGAAIPAPCDAVLKREDVEERGRPVAAIAVPASTIARTRPGAFIRRTGENARRGEVLIGAGSVLTPASLGLLAGVGCRSPRVYAPLRVAIITTGDELVAADSPADRLGPQQTRNSNAPAMHAMLAARRWLSPATPLHVPDDDAALARAIRAAAGDSDAIVTSGGVSMGHRDPVRAALESLGAEVLFHGLPQRPGKPMLGALVGDTPLFALPGNPVSALVTCRRIVVPVLAAAAGCTRLPPPPRVTLANPDGATLDLWWHRPARLDDIGRATLTDTRGSGDLVAAGRSDGFVEVPPVASPALPESPAPIPPPPVVVFDWFAWDG